jgi:molybdopterin/thiamine biosynthesis adenylyltransferase
MTEPMILCPGVHALRIYESGAKYGSIDFKWSERERLALIDGFHIDHGIHKGGRTAMDPFATKEHVLSSLESLPEAGRWYRVDPELHLAGMQARHKSGALALESFRKGVESGWKPVDPGGFTIALTCATFENDSGEEVPNWAGWLLDGSTGQALWCGLEILLPRRPLLEPLDGAWPLKELSELRLCVIGVGSIGSAAVVALAAYGIRHISMIDPDRLLWHNLARHQANWRQVGLLKVEATRQLLMHRDPEIDVEAHALDVIYDADLVRPILDECDLAMVCADGVEARRVANHLARRAGLPSVFACVLENGAYGELHRFIPGRTGCLLCSRETMREEGAIDPEGSLDLPYGTGSRHLPMTAVTGDLALVGGLAAKIAVATLLERAGHRDQRLAGDHAVLALRPKPGRAAPFDLEKTGEIAWSRAPGPRTDCLTCGS